MRRIFKGLGYLGIAVAVCLSFIVVFAISNSMLVGNFGVERDGRAVAAIPAAQP